MEVIIILTMIIVLLVPIKVLWLITEFSDFHLFIVNRFLILTAVFIFLIILTLMQNFKLEFLKDLMNKKCDNKGIQIQL